MPNTSTRTPSPAQLRRAVQFRLLCHSGEAQRIREASGTSLREVARIAGLSKALVGYYEDGTVTPGSVNAAKLAKIYDSLAQRMPAPAPAPSHEKGSPSEGT